MFLRVLFLAATIGAPIEGYASGCTIKIAGTKCVHVRPPAQTVEGETSELVSTILPATTVLPSTSGEARRCTIQTAGSKCAFAKPVIAAVTPVEPLRVDAAPLDPPSKNARFRTGQVLPRGQFLLLLNARSYGLPPASGGMVYFRAQDQVLGVDLSTMEVKKDVTHLLTRELP